jgi:hypothetical protein
MADALIENPIINAPFDEPGRPFRFSEDGITSEVAEERRISSYSCPSPARRRAPTSCAGSSGMACRPDRAQCLH